MSTQNNARAYLPNVTAALLFALAVTLLGLAWFDLVGYFHFLLSRSNI
jgi:hypothetical protein